MFRQFIHLQVKLNQYFHFQKQEFLICFLYELGSCWLYPKLASF